MPNIIKLTRCTFLRTLPIQHSPIFINADSIFSMERVVHEDWDYTVITGSNDENVSVKETPEEILKMLHPEPVMWFPNFDPEEIKKVCLTSEAP